GTRYRYQRRCRAGRWWDRGARRGTAPREDAPDRHAGHRDRHASRRHPELRRVRQPSRAARCRGLGSRGRGACGHRRRREALRRRAGEALLEGREPGEPGLRYDQPAVLRRSAYHPRQPGRRALRRLQPARPEERARFRRRALLRLGARLGGPALRRDRARRAGIAHALGRSPGRGGDGAHDLGHDRHRGGLDPGTRPDPAGDQGGPRGEHAPRLARGPPARGRRAPVAFL
ncbi:MAG: Uncharacterized DUF554 membrane protein, partial [uncultured Rubrobacteraceae bacterium]